MLDEPTHHPVAEWSSTELRREVEALRGENERLLLMSRELERDREASERRSAFLVEAGTALLSSSTDVTQSLQRVAELAVPAVADWCSIEIVEHGARRLLALHHGDPAK